MADIRINALANTASSTASDDYLAVDGTTNGTRKLSAYSPTFGGNLTVSGNASTFGGTTAPSAPVAVITQAPGGNLFPGLGITTAGGSLTKYWNLFSANVYTDSDLFFVPNSTALASAVARISNSGAMTLSGNLTVSGTGTSSFGGEPSTGLATYTGNLRIQSAGNGPAAVNGIELQNSQSGSGYGYKIYTNNSNDYIGIAGRFGSATWTEFLAIKQNTGNLLIGTTSDTGQKLQVKGGTRITDSASASNYITIGSGNDAPYGGNSVVAQTGTLVMGTVASASLLLYTNGTTALTLDSSQNATFAGSIAIGNTVQTAAAVVSTHKVTISIGGSTYYLLATNV